MTTFDDGAGPETFVVRAAGQWWLAPLAASTPTPLSTSQLIQSVLATVTADNRSHAGSPADGLQGDALPGEAIVAPRAVLVGHAVAGRVAVPGARDALVALDETDVELLDALTDPTAVTDLDVSTPLPERGRRLGRLVSYGIVRLVPPEPSGGSDEPAAPTVHAERRVGPTPLPPTAPDDVRIPVYSVWQPEVGPLLSLAMLTAAARHHRGGALNEQFDIRPPERPETFLADLAGRPGPAVLLSSDYVFTQPANLRLARAALAINPELVVIHGGPSSPKYEADIEQFLDEHGDVAHVLTRGEGEHTICELLEALGDSLPALDPTRLGTVAGICFRDPDTRVTVRTPDRERIAELDTLPSPFLTGEFDHIPAEQWTQPPYFETNRGCPYGCTFCDWGSATQSRIRKFALDRLVGEFEWAAARGLTGVHLCDANFGILPRDVEVAQALADLRRREGTPTFVMFSPPKNTTRHITKILDVLADAGIAVNTSISLQTTDEVTLDAVGRHNIATDAYVALAADLRRRGHALTGDLILGLPGQTYEAFRADLQFMLDHEIMPRTWSLRMLPNSPMNDPEYREHHRISVNTSDVVESTAAMDHDARARAARLRHAEIICERYGVLRHLMRFLQWDHGIPATRVMEAMLTVADGPGEDHPSITWLFNYFDLFPASPLGWRRFYTEIHALVVGTLGVPDSSALECVIRLQEFLMPAPGRTFPSDVQLEHDYLAYHTAATRSLYVSGHAGEPDRPLRDHPPATFTISGDPLGLCDEGLSFVGDSRGQVYEGDFQIGALACNELESPLVRLLPRLTGHQRMISIKLATAVPPGLPEDAGVPETPTGAVPVLLGRSTRDAAAG